MSEEKHTKAPWRIDGEPFDAEVGVDIIGVDDITICEVHPLCEDWTNEEIANARLIAAAPELLAALKFCASVLSANPAEMSEKLAIETASKAIAAAEGRS